MSKTLITYATVWLEVLQTLQIQEQIVSTEMVCIGIAEAKN